MRSVVVSVLRLQVGRVRIEQQHDGDVRPRTFLSDPFRRASLVSRPPSAVAPCRGSFFTKLPEFLTGFAAFFRLYAWSYLKRAEKSGR